MNCVLVGLRRKRFDDIQDTFGKQNRQELNYEWKKEGKTETDEKEEEEKEGVHERDENDRVIDFPCQTVSGITPNFPYEVEYHQQVAGQLLY